MRSLPVMRTGLGYRFKGDHKNSIKIRIMSEALSQDLRTLSQEQTLRYGTPGPMSSGESKECFLGENVQVRDCFCVVVDKEIHFLVLVNI